MPGELWEQAEEDLREQMQAVSTPRFLSTKAELIEHYQATYTGRGQAGWKQRIVHDLAAITGMKPKNLEKRFEKRINNPEPRNKAQYEELGRQIGPVGYDSPPYGYKVTFVGSVHISKNCYPKDFTIFITGTDAVSFAEDPTIALVMLTYFEEDLADDLCDEPYIVVAAAEEGEAETRRDRRKDQKKKGAA